jgi:hypothetical protein
MEQDEHAASMVRNGVPMLKQRRFSLCILLNLLFLTRGRSVERNTEQQIPIERQERYQIALSAAIVVSVARNCRQVTRRNLHVRG